MRPEGQSHVGLGRGARFRGGLFLVSIDFRSDRVVFNVLTSRPTSYGDLAERLTLRDNLGTDYALQPFDDIDGKGAFEFTPSIPDAATSWQLGEPGMWLYAVAFDEES